MEEIKHQAGQLEKDYQWLGAAESYAKALNLLPENDFSRKSEMHERLAYARYRAAFQADSSNDFRERLQNAVEQYKIAKEFYLKTREPGKGAMMLRCGAMIAFASYWLASTVSEKKRLLDECWRLTKEALKSLDEIDSFLEYGETYNQLSSSAAEKYCFEESFQSRGEVVREAMQRGERAIVLLSRASAPCELARAYVKTATYLSDLAWHFVPNMDEKDSYYKKGLEYWQKAIGLSEETAYIELLSKPGDTVAWNNDEILTQFNKALSYAKKTRDKYRIGTAFEWLKYATGWTRQSIEDPDKVRQVNEKVLQYARDARHQFSMLSYVSPHPGNWIEVPDGDSYWILALGETDLKKKRNLLERAVIEQAGAVKKAVDAGYPEVITNTHSMLGRCLVLLAKMETKPEEKRKLLESANEHIKEELKLREQISGFNYWNLGVSWQNLADLSAELSQIETNDEKTKNLLEEAVSYHERALQFMTKHASYEAKKGDLILMANFGIRQYVYGERLDLLYGVTHDDEIQKKALKAFKDSAESFQKLNLISRVAESYWKIARSHDVLGEHLNAAENFNFASDNYLHSAEKIPQLKSFYQDHAAYMRAWSEIEIAKDHHKRQEYGSAKDHFEKAADLHKSLKHWNYLAPNYAAWAELERAEELSRNEQDEDARKLFTRAARLFDETRESIQSWFEKIEDVDEKRMATNVLKATDARREYCEARIAIEDAKILDKKGDHYSSSKKYGVAVEVLERIGQRQESEQEKREIEFITILSRAWQKMTLAEAEASPALYAEAAELFERIRDYAPNEKIKMLALGNSRFCKALEAGTRFADTRDVGLHSEAERYLESAANYYVKAGFPKVSEYAEATGLLFDAYENMDEAKREKDLERKTTLYAMAERVLQTSAGSFMKAEHPEKREQVLGLLEKVKKEQELALSLTELLHAPSIASTTTSFTSPNPSREEAVGSERFEHADVQANLIVRHREMKVGEDLKLEIELVNAGKGPALLIKVNEVIPQGFELIEKQDIYRVEDSYINLRGKRLDPLKTEDVKLVLKPRVQGTFTLKPTILYLDENGRYKSYELETVTIMVKELGIKGWLKGER